MRRFKRSRSLVRRIVPFAIALGVVASPSAALATAMFQSSTDIDFTYSLDNFVGGDFFSGSDVVRRRDTSGNFIASDSSFASAAFPGSITGGSSIEDASVSQHFSISDDST